jgi:hypothetical protein
MSLIPMDELQTLKSVSDVKDGEYYHVAMFGDLNDCSVFDRNELKVRKSI